MNITDLAVERNLMQTLCQREGAVCDTASLHIGNAQERNLQHATTEEKASD